MQLSHYFPQTCLHRACMPGFSRFASSSRKRAASTTQKSCISLFEWATGKTQHSVAIEELSGAGRGLFATQDIAPGEKILSIPFDKVYSSKPEDELEFHWSVDMALRLLRDKQACHGVASGGNSKWCEWLAQLPTHVLTPLEFTEEEVAAMGDEGLAAEVRAMQQCMEASHEVLQEELQEMGSSYQDFLAAVQVLHSRCFFQPETGCHMAVPGIDMANHSATPNAQVAVQHSPHAVQGLAAIEEVCDPSTLQRESEEQSQFQLVAGHHGIRKGDEVTISYGSMWPDAAFLLLFGFLPRDNPQNSCQLFLDVPDMVACYTSLQQQACPQLSGRDNLSGEVCECVSSSWEDSGGCRGLFITKHGLDGRLPVAFQVIEDCFRGMTGQAASSQRIESNEASTNSNCSSSSSSSSSNSIDGAQVSLPALLQHRAAQRMRGLKELHEAELQRAQGNATSQGMALARAFRQRQMDVLQSFLEAAQS